MTTETIPVPDLGGADEVDVIEICVAVGDSVQAEDSLVVLESDKASMEVPSPKAGKIVEIKLAVGDKVSQGDAIVVIEAEAAAAESADQPSDQQDAPQAEESQPAEPASSAPAPAPSGSELISIPDLGSDDEVDVIEVCVKAGDEVAEGDSLIVLESDKASMEVPSPRAGTVRSLKVSEGDKVRSGSPIVELEVSAAADAGQPSAAEKTAPAETAQRAQRAPEPVQPAAPVSAPVSRSGDDVYAGPAVRKLAREMGINLGKVPGTGPKGRILKEDVQDFVKSLVEGGAAVNAAIPAIPEVDFAQFGEVDIQPMSKLHKVTAANMQRSWLNVPHVTQFDEADITELESFRQELKAEAQKRNTKVTPFPFLLKACAWALQAHPKLNASLAADGEHVVYKRYVHIGMAVDTPAGLLVPVIRDVDRKSVWELSEETAELAEKARDRKLKPDEMKGGCFTISSLGSIGGQGFTPVVNTPEVAILGVSKLAVKPVWDGSQFVPRKMLPLSLSYDHRAVNGGDAGRFMTELVTLLSDVRRLLL